MKLHPDAVPRKEPDPQHAFESLLDLCQSVIKSESWERVLRAEKIPGTSLVRIVAIDHRPEARDASIVFTDSENRFQEGLIPRQTIRNSCQAFLVATDRTR